MSDANNNAFSEAVAIQTSKIFDSCSDKDCIEDLEVSFASLADQTAVENANFIKAKCCEVINATFGIDPVPFNKGFYTVDITYTFKVDLDAYVNAMTPPTPVTGTATFDKKVILYGGDGGAKVFSSDDTAEPVSNTGSCCCDETLPVATVSVVEPIVLDAAIVCRHHCRGSQSCPVIGETDTAAELQQTPTREVLVTIGMFSIVSLSRPVPLLVPVYDYGLPEKECSTNTDSPCELFDKISFPIDEFFPKSLEDTDSDSSCGCRNNNN